MAFGFLMHLPIMIRHAPAQRSCEDDHRRPTLLSKVCRWRIGGALDSDEGGHDTSGVISSPTIDRPRRKRLAIVGDGDGAPEK